MSSWNAELLIQFALPFILNSTYRKNCCQYNYYEIYRLRMEAEFTDILIDVYIMYAKKKLRISWK